MSEKPQRYQLPYRYLLLTSVFIAILALIAALKGELILGVLMLMYAELREIQFAIYEGKK